MVSHKSRALTSLLALLIGGQIPEQLVYAIPDGSWSVGADFNLVGSNDRLSISRGVQEIWSTVPGTPFIGASAGNDSFTGSNGAFNITEYDIDACQGQEVSGVDYVDWEEAASGSATQISGSLTDCGDGSAPYTLTFWVPINLTDRVAFYLDVESSSDLVRPLKKLYLRYASNAQEDFYGFGGQASFASLKGQRIPIFTREQGEGRGDQPLTSIQNANGSFAGGNQFTTYTAIPSYITTDGRVLYLSVKSHAYAVFDLTEPDVVSLRYDSLSVDGMVMQAENMFDAVEMLTDYTGRMPKVPEWADSGAILGIQGGQEKVNQIVEQGLELDCPIAGVWLQDWCGTHEQEAPYFNRSRLWWNWENDELLYPDWNEFVQNLRSEHNVRTLSYINVFLANVSTKPDGFHRNLYDEAAALDYFVQNTTTNELSIISSGPGLNAGIIDLTNQDFIEWFRDVMRTQVYNGNISGFMSDFGEYTPVTADTELANMVSDAFFFHNSYPLLWAEFQRDLVEDLGIQDERLIFHRSASMGANKYMNLFWVGDQNVDWGLNDGIKSVVTIMLHMGLSGYAHQHSDVGGYTTILTYEDFNVTRSPELLGRWGELAAVSSAVFRSHEGNVPQVNAQFYSNESTYSYYGYNARMFASLGPYRRMIMDTECSTRGWPLLRPPMMYHIDDQRARNISYQSFYLGPSLYVAPVLDPQTFELEVYLPGADQTFMHVWTGMTFNGGQDVTVPAPYGQPAVFVVNDADRTTTELESFLDFVRRENGTRLSID